MKSADFPERKCRESVWNDLIAYSCELPDLHGGPCASTSFTPSVTRRDEWEKANPTWRADMKDDPYV